MIDEQMIKILLIMVIIGIIVLSITYFILYYKNKKQKNKNKDQMIRGINTDKANVASEIRADRNSIFKFMEFDKVQDNMIVQNNGERYLMVVECKGVNYDLLSSVEKTGVEQGFLQFLNTLRDEVQLYVQTRKINLDSSIDNYNKRLNDVQYDLRKEESIYKEMIKSGKYSDKQLKMQQYEIVRKRNLYEYGADIISSTENMSLNKNILTKQYYVIVSYYPRELGENNFDQGEIRNIAFSELYTKAQAVTSSLAACDVRGHVLNSRELIELLYVAYNRDQADIYDFEKHLQAGYEKLYSTAPDVIEKKIEVLDKEIADRALEKANRLIENTANRIEKRRMKEVKDREENMQKYIDELAEYMIDENAETLGKDFMEELRGNGEKTEEKGEQTNEVVKPKRGRKPKAV